MILAVTGHRPNKLGGYRKREENKLTNFAEIQLRKAWPKKVITGMGMGWDQAIARACIRLKIPYIAAIPFVGQENAWYENTQEEYRELLSRACEIKVVCDGAYEAWKMHKRNEWMVDNSDKLMALFDGSPGGTANCVRYAAKIKKEQFNVWIEWTKYAKAS